MTAISNRVRPFSKPFQLATRLSRLRVRPSSSTSGGRRRTSAPRRVSIICAVVRAMPRHSSQSGAFALRGVGGGGGLRRDGGKRLTEFVVQLAGKVAPLLVLHFYE